MVLCNALRFRGEDRVVEVMEPVGLGVVGNGRPSSPSFDSITSSQTPSLSSNLGWSDPWKPLIMEVNCYIVGVCSPFFLLILLCE